MRLTIALPALLAALLLVQQPANAQSTGGSAHVIGNTVLGGKRVELMSDRTWRFATMPEADDKCVPINTALSFCGTILDWRPISTSGSDFIRVFQHDARNQAGIIYENIGKADGLKREDYRSVIISGVAMVMGVPDNEVPVIDVFDQSVDSVPGETMIYGARIHGLNFVYINTSVLMDSHAIQYVTWSLGSELTDDHRALHDSFIVANRITVEDSDS